MAKLRIPAEKSWRKRFGRLLVIRIFYKNNRAWGVCRCICGKIVNYLINSLRTGNSVSCGCWKKEYFKKVGKNNITHGEYSKGRTTEIITYTQIKQRCYNPKATGFENYGGRGIKVCSRWLGKKGFKHFLKDMGRKPGSNFSIDRINVDGNYEPNNCKWATRREQEFNKRKLSTWRAPYYLKHWQGLKRDRSNKRLLELEMVIIDFLTLN